MEIYVNVNDRVEEIDKTSDEVLDDMETDIKIEEARGSNRACINSRNYLNRRNRIYSCTHRIKNSGTHRIRFIWFYDS